MAEAHFPFRTVSPFRNLLRISRFHPEIDGVRVHDDGSVSIVLGRRILQTTAANISGIDQIDSTFWPMSLGVRRLPGSTSVSFVTDAGPALRLSFRESVSPAAGPMPHEEAVITIERHTELLPAVLGARRAAERTEAERKNPEPE